MPPTRSWDAVLFDLDGTLIDSVPLILDSFRHTFAACSLPVPTAAELLRGVGTPLAVHFARYTTDPDLVGRLVETYRDYNLSNHDARVRAFPGVREVLEHIRAAGLPTAVVTSKNRSTTERGLRVTELAPLVDVIVPSDEVTHPKPHPESVARALDLLLAAPGRAVFVGDSIHDLQCGRAAGVRTVAALWGPFTRGELEPGAPDFWADEPASLLTALGLG